jgi:hypothetical protein
MCRPPGSHARSPLSHACTGAAANSGTTAAHDVSARWGSSLGQPLQQLGRSLGHWWHLMLLSKLHLDAWQPVVAIGKGVGTWLLTVGPRRPVLVIKTAGHFHASTRTIRAGQALLYCTIIMGGKLQAAASCGSARLCGLGKGAGPLLWGRRCAHHSKHAIAALRRSARRQRLSGHRDECKSPGSTFHTCHPCYTFPFFSGAPGSGSCLPPACMH